MSVDGGLIGSQWTVRGSRELSRLRVYGRVGDTCVYC